MGSHTPEAAAALIFWVPVRSFAAGFGLLRRFPVPSWPHFAARRADSVLPEAMEDDGASTACATEFAGDVQAMGEVMTARLQGLAPLNMSNLLINDDAPNQDEELDSAAVRARATRLLTEGDCVGGQGGRRTHNYYSQPPTSSSTSR